MNTNTLMNSIFSCLLLATGCGANTTTTESAENETGTSTPEAGGSSSAQSNGEVMKPAPLRILSGFSRPESAHYHAPSLSWFISNIAGETGAADGVGWITRLDADFQVIDDQWVSGLNSPAGLVSNGDTLYVADMNRVVALRIATGTVLEEWVVDGAGLLNDTALHADGSVYVSDTFANAIYRLTPGGTPELIHQDPKLKGPNGLLIQGDTLWIASSGSFVDFKEEAGLFKLKLSTNELSQVLGVSGKFDGIEGHQDGLLLSDFRGKLLLLDAQEKSGLLYDFVEAGQAASTADIGYDPQTGRVVLPDLLGDKVLVYSLD